MAQICEGRVVIVTGAGRGVGRGIARALARAGASVAVAEIDSATGAATVAELAELGRPGLLVECDVTQRSSVDSAVSTALDAFGRLDILVNNAQRAPQTPVPLIEHTDEIVDMCFDSGFRGTLYCMQACYPALRRRGGRIINLGSDAGLDGMAGQAAYGATKEAIRALSKTAAREWGADGITVNVICPFAKSPALEEFLASAPEMEARLTAHHPIRRIGDCEHDIAPAVVFLASEGARYVTGQTLPVNGGGLMIR
jgi:NAD(P)-dependent dehydrogenase (short-subunit alcohol dehydrogenase family)